MDYWFQLLEVLNKPFDGWDILYNSVETANCQRLRTLPTLSAECKDHVGRIRIRKEVNRLTDDEKTILNSALQKAIDNADPATGLYFKDIANYHGSPTTICGGSPCCPHGLQGFFSWHRLFTGTYLSSKPTSNSKICHKYEYYRVYLKFSDT